MTAKKTTHTKTSGRNRKAQSVNRTVGGDASGAHAQHEVYSEQSEDRGSRRVPIQLLVDYKAEGNYLFDFCKDLGTGGVFIQTHKPLPTGASIDLTFTIPDSKQTLIAKGTVIWVQDAVPDRKDLTPGMGVQFAGFSGEQRRLLDEFVQRYHGGRMSTTVVGKRAV